MKLDEFITTKINTNVDYDGYYGAQCVDLFRQYCKDVLEIPVHTGAVSGAKEIWTNYDNLPNEVKYFARVVGNPLSGDVVVWDSTKSNNHGHVAIYLGTVDKEHILVFEQDGFKLDGAKVKIRSTENILGFLRRKWV